MQEKLALTLLMLAAACNAIAAGWAPIGAMPEYKVYGDQASIMKQGR